MIRGYEDWLQNCTDETLKKELLSLKGDAEKINDRFYCELTFGTGGLRGEIAAGANRMNIYTVGKATQGLADYLKATFEHPSVALSRDNRRNSELFCAHTAAILAANGIKVYMYPVLEPTPMLSWAVRYYQCSGGIMITASHNPAVYNGYKVYGPDGCQITDEAAHAIEKCIDQVDIFDDVKIAPLDEMIKAGTVEYISDQCNEDYLNMIQQLAPGEEKKANALSIVYTPLNGTGRVPVQETLKRAGFNKVTVVREQEMPDPDFPTCPYPNPEIREALELGIRTMKETGADLLLATDPDCDRVGTAVWDGEELKLMSGNEIGVLLMDYVCKNRLESGTMPKDPVMVKTIVTTEQAEVIAAHYGIELRNVLTGFKYIGEQIGLLEKEGHPERYLLGFEESYGYLSGADVRDKDGVNAALLICRMVADWKARGLTLADALRDVQSRFGAYEQGLESITFRGENGMKEMKRIMDVLRQEPPKEIMGLKLTVQEDYLMKKVKDLTDGSEKALELPKSNVLKFRFGSEATLVARPSGTEPKLKLYYAVKAETAKAAKEKLESFKQAVRPVIDSL